MPDWLPPIIPYSDFNGDWEAFLTEIYRVFLHEYSPNNLPYFEGERLKLKRHPIEAGKEATFWHLTSEGRVEADRTPDLRRCERILWAKAIIQNMSDPDVKIWDIEVKNEVRTCLWLEEGDYVVVVARREGYNLLWTAYSVDYEHTRNKFRRQYGAFVQAQKG